MFLVDTDSSSKCTFKDFVDDTKLCSMMSTLEGRDVIQRELDRFEKVLPRVCAWAAS